MKSVLSLCVATSFGLALAACSSRAVDCKTVPCMTGTNTYELCGNIDANATYKFGGTSCNCSGVDTSACTSCSNKLAAYCASLPDGSTDGATGPDLASDSSTCSIVGTFSGMVTGGNKATLASTGTSTSGSYTLTIAPMTPAIYIAGNYAYANGSLTMTNASSSSTPSCVGMAEVLTVAWANNCKSASFTKATDACAGRTTDLNGDTLLLTIPDMSL